MEYIVYILSFLLRNGVISISKSIILGKTNVIEKQTMWVDQYFWVHLVHFLMLLVLKSKKIIIFVLYTLIINHIEYESTIFEILEYLCG